ncbi:MAG: universal stress protein [Alphaproteobacteria bacterium]|nr:universal stress protein [Alphaproteobacteria bacterium]
MYKNILLPIDLDENRDIPKTIETAIALSQLYNAQLYVMTVLPDFGMSIVGSYFKDGFEKDTKKHAKDALRAYIDKHFADIDIKMVVATGTIYREIIAAGKKLDIDLIIMASGHEDIEDYLLGSNAARVVRHSKQSVMVVR